jgi:hypothetical protein
LFPLKKTTIREMTYSWNCLAFETLLVGTHVRNRDDPSQPTTTERTASTNGLSIGYFFSGWVIEDFDNLNMASSLNWD